MLPRGTIVLTPISTHGLWAGIGCNNKIIGVSLCRAISRVSNSFSVQAGRLLWRVLHQGTLEDGGEPKVGNQQSGRRNHQRNITDVP